MSTAVDFLSGAAFQQATFNGSIGVTFQKSRSVSYPVALELARHGEFYADAEIGIALLHFAVFGRNKEQAECALSLVRTLRGAKGAQFFAAGRTVDQFRAASVLACYLEAGSATDWRAHCLTIAGEREIFQDAPRSPGGSVTVRLSFAPMRDEPPKPPPPRYLLPCAFMRRHGLRLDHDHPSRLRDQIQSRAVELGCDWCPRFDIQEFRRS